ncbi:putative DNA primase/helicase [Extensimonas vulgaris]|jgi:putative DNA primase/helicase|uniref:Putative DNA primase/helicase n=1 Tax=Extensimonas vulgaris TaxID=1031594 RepID=A0A369AIZ7_9BURK|nr:DUF3987 domain-containing protein [Extensimonas vulgaris]RCX08256.1 putative DNA primase/helicase [Extensimonas vulgaris]TWI37472.1 putative DNA primase/helicase [Extensimonas vulgaris]TXD13846.1 DUF3987 domain-containing protein [Extensimonas vulgaris]
MTVIDQFQSAIAAAGLAVPDVIHADGALHRYSTNGKRSDTSGWYVLHDDGDMAAGAFGCWRTGMQQNWCSKDVNRLTPAQRSAHQQRMQAIAQQRDADKAQRHQDAAGAAAKRWEAALPAPADHPYLVRKGIRPHGIKTEGEALLIPLRDASTTLHSLQAIGPEGDKRFQPGGRIKGCYFGIGKPKGVLIVCEGFATGASIHEATGHAVACAMNAGNLLEVAQALHSKYPKLRLILAADDDWKTEGNPGIAKATEAAKAVGGLLAVPRFTGERGDGETDFNDLHLREQFGAVRRCIEAAAPVAISPAFPALEDGAGGGAWVDPALPPEPLRATLPPAAAYPVEALGDVLGSAAQALHDAVKAPLAMCAQSVLAAASLAAQAHFDVLLPWGGRKPTSLFLLTVGESGERKSAIDDLVLGAAKAQEKKAMEAYEQALAEHEQELASWQKAVDAARSAATQGKKGTATSAQVQQAVQEVGPKPEAPVAPLRFVTDPTVEGLYKLLALAQPSVALFSDEGGLLIGGHALNSDNALKTMARWCKLWDGSPFDRVRAGDGVGILYGRRMCMHQLAQGDVMVKLLSDRMANGQGLLARCLVAWPESTIGTRQVDQFEWAGDRRELKRMFAVLSGLMEAAPPTSDECGQVLEPVELELTDEAKALSIAAHNQFETLMAPGCELSELRDRASKALENACRIAGVLTAIEQGVTARHINAETLARGLVLVQWYLAETLRVRGVAAVPREVQDAETLLAWLRERGMQRFRTAPVLTKGPAQLRNKARLTAAVDALVSTGYLLPLPAGTEIDGIKARLAWEVLNHVV